MSGRSLHVERLAIHAVRGIPHGEGFTCDDLGPGITVLHGPNGIGKSTTACALVELLRPGASPLGRGTLAGRYRLDGATWEVDIEAGHATWLRDGAPHAPPDLPPASAVRCCRLALPDLLADDEEDFAAAVLRASQGNYDLRAATAALELGRTPTGAASAKTALDTRTAAVRAAEATQRALLLRAEELAGLREKCADAERARTAADRTARALAALDASAECAALRARRDALPSAVGVLTGQEQERLDELDEERRRLEAQRDADVEARRAAEVALAACGLPADGVDAGVCTDLPLHRDDLAAIDDELADAEREQRRAAAGEAAARARLGAALTDEQLAALDRVRTDGLDELARRAETLRGEREALRRRAATLADDGDDAAPAATVRAGLDALAGWLAVPAGGAGPAGRIALVAVAVLAGAGLAAAVVHHPAWLACTVVAAVLGAWLVRATRRRTAGGAVRAAFRTSFQGTGLEPPPAWTTDGVRERHAALAPLHAAATLREERAALRRALDADVAALAERERALDADVAARSAELGLRLVPGDAWMVTLVAAIAAWQAARDEGTRRTAEVEHLRQRRERAITTIGDGLASVGLERPSTSAAARGAVDDLLGRVERRTAASAGIEAASRRLRDHIEPALDANDERRRELFAQLELAAGDEAGLAALLAQRSEWRTLSEALRDATSNRDRLRTELGPGAAALVDRERDELDAERADLERRAARRDDLQRDITAIETEIEQARRGHDLGDALAARDAAVDDLRAKRTEHERRRVALELVEHLRVHTVDASRPAVFARASALLSEITRGRFALELDEGEPPAFRARDTLGGRVRSLDELSSGERVQVLLAVRIAFLEREEGGTRLPLLLDEVLATSDDDRARRVIDAATEIARSGRQVFVFSAQPDEVGKWRGRLAERGPDAGVDLRLVDLAALRGRAAAVPIPAAVPRAVSVPPPDGDDIVAYRARLHVPPLRPIDDGVGGVHLAHLLDDPGLLHRLLRDRVSCFGPLERLVELGGGGLLAPNDEAWRRTVRRATLVRTAFALWRRGRGRPVDRSVLLESGAVSEMFLDAVAAEAAAVHGDAAALVERARALKGLGPAKVAKLRETLADIGCLDEGERLDAEALRLELRGRAPELDDADRAWLDRLLAGLPGLGRPGAPASSAAEPKPDGIDAATR